MIIRDCAGGVVFKDSKVFLLKNEKDEWILPKGKIRGEQLPSETAIQRVKYETGIDAKIVSPAGETAYEFFSRTRNQAVYNKIIWYIMESNNLEYSVNFEEGFKEGNFFEIDEALNMITYSQDKSLVSLSYKRYLEFKEYEKNLLYA